MNPVPLVCRLGALGDMVACTPALKYLAEQSGHPCDVIAGGGWSYDLFAHLPFIGQVHVLKSRNTPYWFNADKRQLVSVLKRRDVGPCWVFGNSKHVLPLLKRGGYSSSHIALPQPSVEPIIHVGDDWLKVAAQRPVGSDISWALPDDFPVNWELKVSAEEISDAKQWLAQRQLLEKNYVVIQLGNKKTMRVGDPQRTSNTKYWPVNRWAEVITNITKEHSLPVVLVGTPEEGILIDEVINLVKSPLVQAAYQDVGIRRLAAVLHLAHSCISVDTGPAHMAAAVNCPVLVLFGEANPARHCPRSTESIVRCLSGEIDTQLPSEEVDWAAWHGMSGIHSESVLLEWKKYFL